MAPFPPKGAEGALGSPWPPLGPLPLGPLGFLWVPLGPLGSHWVPLASLGSPPPRDLDSSRRDKIASQSLAGGDKIARENILGRWHVRKRIEDYFTRELYCV